MHGDVLLFGRYTPYIVKNNKEWGASMCKVPGKFLKVNG